MQGDRLTDAELLVLGLVSEMPRHGYELEQVIEDRGMREWTQIGFSSIYFVLGKLQKGGLIAARRSTKEPRARKVFTITARGRNALVRRTSAALADVRPTYSSVLLGMIHWSVLSRDEALKALATRSKAIQAELARLEDIHIDKQPLPDFVDVLFEYSTGQLRAEAEWTTRTLDYMKTKPWQT